MNSFATLAPLKRLKKASDDDKMEADALHELLGTDTAGDDKPTPPVPEKAETQIVNTQSSTTSDTANGATSFGDFVPKSFVDSVIMPSSDN